jgi:hypothetical protein
MLLLNLLLSLLVGIPTVSLLALAHLPTHPLPKRDVGCLPPHRLCNGVCGAFLEASTFIESYLLPMPNI